jgi:hypothetical protein
MTRMREKVVRHYAKVRAGIAFASVCALAPSVVACEPRPLPSVSQSSEPATAAMASDTEVEARLYPPKGSDWRIGEVLVKNAKLLSRDGESPLVLRMARSQPGMGETTVEGADEPIEVTVTWVDKANKSAKATAVFKLTTSPTAKQGENVPVDTQW